MTKNNSWEGGAQSSRESMRYGSDMRDSGWRTGEDGKEYKHISGEEAVRKYGSYTPSNYPLTPLDIYDKILNFFGLI